MLVLFNRLGDKETVRCRETSKNIQSNKPLTKPPNEEPSDGKTLYCSVVKQFYRKNSYPVATTSAFTIANLSHAMFI